MHMSKSDCPSDWLQVPLLGYVTMECMNKVHVLAHDFASDSIIVQSESPLSHCTGQALEVGRIASATFASCVVLHLHSERYLAFCNSHHSMFAAPLHNAHNFVGDSGDV